MSFDKLIFDVMHRAIHRGGLGDTIRLLKTNYLSSSAYASKPPSTIPTNMQNSNRVQARKRKSNEPDNVVKKAKAVKIDKDHVFERDVIPRREMVAQDGYEFFKVLSWNVNGLRALVKNKKDILEKLIKEEKPDVLCLQETKLQESHVEDFKLLVPGYESFFSCSTAKKGYSGTAVFVSKSSKCKTWEATYGIDHGDHDSEGRCINLKLPFVNLTGLYVPNAGQKLERLAYRTEKWDLDLREFAKKQTASTSDKPTILYGDMNVAHKDIDLYNPDAKHIPKTPGCTDAERASFTKLLEEDKVLDSFRFLHPQAKGAYTYWSTRAGGRPFNRGLRLDYFCVPETIAKPNGHHGVTLFDSFILEKTTLGASDHCPVGLVLKVETSKLN